MRTWHRLWGPASQRARGAQSDSSCSGWVQGPDAYSLVTSSTAATAVNNRKYGRCISLAARLLTGRIHRDEGHKSASPFVVICEELHEVCAAGRLTPQM